MTSEEAALEIQRDAIRQAFPHDCLVEFSDGRRARVTHSLGCPDVERAGYEILVRYVESPYRWGWVSVDELRRTTDE